MPEPQPGLDYLLAEHTRLVRAHGAQSKTVYEFEMRYLNNAEFLWSAWVQKRQYLSAQSGRRFFFLGCLALLTVAALQAIGFAWYFSHALK